ncbi:uncharacterized protein LOC141677024 [Apium graveolens]|uniref:uncharacterized protein LOC141677024 n=1 Tax=Apium graveolens TaxID=4045 RepID=UPI003D7A1234
MGDILTERVIEYVTSGSKISSEEAVLMEKSIKEREKIQSISNMDLRHCTTNQGRDYLTDPDDTDQFMMQGVNIQGNEGEYEDWCPGNDAPDHQLVKNIFNRLFRRWDWISNYLYCSRGCRIVLGWNPDVFDVLEIFTADQVIYCVVTILESKISFHCSIVYAANKYVDSRKLWQALCSYSMLNVKSLWIIMGDFNATLSESECLGGAETHSPSTQEF